MSNLGKKRLRDKTTKVRSIRDVERSKTRNRNVMFIILRSEKYQADAVRHGEITVNRSSD